MPCARDELQPSQPTLDSLDVSQDGKQPAGGKRVRPFTQTKNELPAQSSTMHNFFKTRTPEEAAAEAEAAKELAIAEAAAARSAAQAPNGKQAITHRVD